MIDWIHKLPDSAIGLVAAGSLWFGFNYAVLGERAMERYAHDEVLPACLATFRDPAPARVPKLGLGKLFGMPELDELEDQLVQQATPPLISTAEKIASCECSVAVSAGSLHLDFAIATATFRVFAPDSIAAFRRNATLLVSNGGCFNSNS